MEEEAVAVVNRDGYTQLLKGPCRGGPRGHLDVEDFFEPADRTATRITVTRLTGSRRA
jgi:hypothetical protein